MKWQQFRRYVYFWSWLSFFSVVPTYISWWLHYHHLPHWSTIVLDSLLALVGAAILVKRETNKRKVL